VFFPFKYNTFTMYIGYVFIPIKILKLGSISVILKSISYLI